MFCWTTLIIMHGKYVPVFEMLYNNIGYLNTLILVTLIPWAVSSEFGVSYELFTAVKGFSHLVFTSPWKPKCLKLNSKCNKRYKLCTQQSVPLIIIRTFFSQFFGRIIFFQCLIDFLSFIQPVFCCLELCSPILRKMWLLGGRDRCPHGGTQVMGDSLHSYSHIHSLLGNCYGILVLCVSKFNQVTNANGRQCEVPSVCFVIPAPDVEATEFSTR